MAAFGHPLGIKHCEPVYRQRQMRVTLPQAVAVCFSASPPEWRIRAIRKLQSAFWADASVCGAGTMSVYVDNLRMYRMLRAADMDVVYALVERLSSENGLRAEYDALLAEAAAAAALADPADVDGDGIELVAPDDVL